MNRILWLLRYPPVSEEKGGDAVYSRELLRHTALHADITALSFVEDRRLDGNAAAWNGVRWRSAAAVPRRNVLSLASTLPSIAFRYTRAAFVAEAVRQAEAHDAVVLDHIGLVFLAERMRRALGTRCPAIVPVFHDHGATLRRQMARNAPTPAMRAALTLDWLKASALERRALRAADGFGAITPADLAAFERDAGAVPGICLPPGYDGPRVAERRIRSSDPPRIVILGGRTSLHKQIVLARVLDKLVESRVAESLQIDVVGGQDGPDPRYPGIRFVGYVDDLEACMRTVRLGLIPDDVGGGFKLRALSHVFLRVPMLGLTQALDGTGLRPDIDFFAAGSLDELVRRIPAIIGDVDRLDAVQAAAYAACERDYAWGDRGRAFAAFVQSRVAARRNQPQWRAAMT